MPDRETPPYLRVVTPQTAPEEIREKVVAELERALVEARAGEIDEIFMILRHPGDDQWSNRATPTMGLTAWIGKLEITKQAWIDIHNAKDERK